MAWPGDIESVTVTWMNGNEVTYPCNTVKVENGELRLSMIYKGSIGFSDLVRDERSFPLINIQLYVTNRVT